MTPEAQRIAIAEACGWSRADEYDEGFGGRGTLRLTTGWKNNEGIWFRVLPDYLSDLNATHEAETRFNNSKDADTYVRHLVRITRNLIIGEDRLIMNTWVVYAIAHATAAQRAEAFLRTIGNWDDLK